MRKITMALLATLVASPVFAQTKDCDELKAEIDAKIAANGVASFTTTIVDRDAAADGRRGRRYLRERQQEDRLQAQLVCICCNSHPRCPDPIAERRRRLNLRDRIVTLSGNFDIT